MRSILCFVCYVNDAINILINKYINKYINKNKCTNKYILINNLKLARIIIYT